MIGTTISHYKIVDKLGEGGMGVVYKADDLRLKRQVALKFLSSSVLADEDHKARFQREAQAAAGLDHPNVCTVYESGEVGGETFIAMAYLQGPSLKERLASGPVPLDEALEIAQQIGRGLQAAHRQGVVHRDIKPANVIVTPEGAQIVDFGLAQLTGDGGLTGRRTALGTTAYMSPEQTMAEPLDARTDIWSLGVLIFEMVAGSTPFRGHYDDAIVYAIVNEEPAKLKQLRDDVPFSLERIVSKALAKNPDERYSEVEELLADVKALQQEASSPARLRRGENRPVETTGNKRLASPGGLDNRKRRLVLGAAAAVAALLSGIVFFFPTGEARAFDSIAILPLDNFSNNSADDYFVDGMHEALISELAQIKALAVISRTSVNRYRSTDKSLPEIASELDVDVVLEGSVLRAGDSVRITVQLIGTSPERHLWAQSYDGDLKDVLSLHSQVAQAVAKEIRVAVTPDEKARLASTRQVDPAVYQHHLRGRRLCTSHLESEIYRGVDEFRQAIEIDPGYAPPYVGLARCYGSLAFYFLPPEDVTTPMEAAVRKALELDEELGEAHAMLAYSKLVFHRDFSGEAEFRRALELDPNDVAVLKQYGWYLTASARFDEAIATYKRAVELDPLSAVTVQALGWASFVARRNDEAVAHLQRALELSPDFSYPYAFLAACYVQKGMEEEAAAAAKWAEALAPASEDQNLLSVLGWVYASVGRADAAARMLDRLHRLAPRRRVDPVLRAAIYGALGELDRAIELLQQGADTTAVATLLPTHPFVDSMRADPRFDQVLRELGLEP